MLLASEEFDAARKMLLDILEHDPENPRAHAILGEIDFEFRAFKKALAQFERAIELAPEEADYQFLLGRTLASRVGEAFIFSKPGIAKSMRKAFEEAIRLDPQHAPARLALVSFMYRAPGLFGGSKKTAQAHLDSLKEIDGATYERAMARMALKDDRRAEALEHFRASLELRYDKRAADEFAKQLSKDGTWDEALRVLKPALGSPGRTPLTAYLLFGRAAASSGQELAAGARALDHYIAADERRKVKKDQAESHYLRGRIFEAMDEIEAARGAYRNALGVDKAHRPASRALRRLEAAASGG